MSANNKEIKLYFPWYMKLLLLPMYLGVLTQKVAKRKRRAVLVGYIKTK